MEDFVTFITHPSMSHLNAVLLSILAFFMKRFIDGQAEINKTLQTGLANIGEKIHETKEDIVVTQQQVVSLEKREAMRERTNEKRHDDNVKNMDRMWGVVNKLQERKA